MPQKVSESMDNATGQSCGDLQPGGFSLTANLLKTTEHSRMTDMPQNAATTVKADR